MPAAPTASAAAAAPSSTPAAAAASAPVATAAVAGTFSAVSRSMTAPASNAPVVHIELQAVLVDSSGAEWRVPHGLTLAVRMLGRSGAVSYAQIKGEDMS